MPVIRRLDLRFLPIWNSSALKAEWRRQLRLEKQMVAETCHLTPKQLRDRRKHLEVRSLAGPLPRQEIADAASLTLVEVRKLAKARGLWVRAREDEMGCSPFMQLMFQLFKDGGDAAAAFDFEDEVAADAAAQSEIDSLRARRNAPPVLPDRIGIWEIVGEAFLALDKRNGLSWWVEHRCAAEGCQRRVSRWRPVASLKRSRAKQCRHHHQPEGGTLLRALEAADESFDTILRRHVPDLFKGSPELTNPDMAAGALASFKDQLEHPPSLVQEVESVPKLPTRHWSQYFPPAPYEATLEPAAADLSDF